MEWGWVEGGGGGLLFTVHLVVWLLNRKSPAKIKEKTIKMNVSSFRVSLQRRV